MYQRLQSFLLMIRIGSSNLSKICLNFLLYLLFYMIRSTITGKCLAISHMYKRAPIKFGIDKNICEVTSKFLMFSCIPTIPQQKVTIQHRHIKILLYLTFSNIMVVTSINPKFAPTCYARIFLHQLSFILSLVSSKSTNLIAQRIITIKLA